MYLPYQTLTRIFDHISKHQELMEVEKWGTAEFLNESWRRLEMWSNIHASVWYGKYIPQEKIEEVWLFYASVWCNIKTHMILQVSKK